MTTQETTPGSTAGGTRWVLAVLALALLGYAGWRFGAGTGASSSDGPATPERAATEFVTDVGAGRLDAAFARLSPRAHGELGRAGFERALTPALRAASGLLVETAESQSGLGCVEGRLVGVPGEPSYAFAVVEDATGAARVDRWRDGHCIRR